MQAKITNRQQNLLKSRVMNDVLTVVFARIAGIQSFRSATVFAVIVNEHIVGNCEQRAVDADLSGNDDLQ